MALQHREVSGRKEIHCQFAKFLKIIEEVFMFLDLAPMWSSVGGFMFTVCRVPCPLQLVAKDSGSFGAEMFSALLPFLSVWFLFK